MSENIENVEIPEDGADNQVQEAEAVKTASGLFCLHAVSKDRSQRFCTYKEYTDAVPVDQIQEDAYIWFKLQMTVSAVNETFDLYIQKVC